MPIEDISDSACLLGGQSDAKTHIPLGEVGVQPEANVPSSRIIFSVVDASILVAM